MKATTLLCVFSAVAVAACDVATPAEPLSAPVQSLVPVQNQPMNLHTVQVSSTGEGSHIGWCDQAAGLVLASAPGTGTATAVGRFTLAQTSCINLATGAVTGGTATLTGANGDQWFMTSTGHALARPGLPAFDLVYVVTGGTGRFARAEGELTIRVEYTSPTTWDASGDGWLRYAASDRSGT